MVAAKALIRDLSKAPESVMHPVKDQGVESGPCCDDMPAPQPIPAAVCVGDYTTSFLDDQRPGRHIVGAQVQLPKAVKSASGDIGQVHRGRAHPAHPPHVVKEAPKVGEVVVLELVPPIRKARSQHSLSEMLCVSNPKLTPWASRPLPGDRREGLI